MSSTSGTDILLIDPNQLGKAAAADTAFAAIDEMLGGVLAVNAAGNASPYTIPYSTQDEPQGVKTALRFFLMNVTGALTADWTAYLPAGKSKPFCVYNGTSGGHNVIVMVSGQTGVVVPPGEMFFCFLNGTDVQALPVANSASGPQPYDIGNFITGAPTASQVLLFWVAPRTISFPGNFANNQARLLNLPTGTWVGNVTKNGVAVGALQFNSASSTPIWTTTGGSPVVFNAGDYMSLVAPSSPDATFATLSVTFAGTR